MFKKILFTTATGIITAAIGLMFIGNFALAQSSTSTGLIPTASGEQSPNCSAPQGSKMDDKTYCGDYAVSDFIKLAVVVSQWILGIVGSLTLIMFIYGGFMFLISAGSSDKIGQAKKIITASVIGLIIVFSSYLIIRFVMQGINVNSQYQLGNKSTTIKQ